MIALLGCSSELWAEGFPWPIQHGHRPLAGGGNLGKQHIGCEAEQNAAPSPLTRLSELGLLEGGSFSGRHRKYEPD